ncbi:hypothetical protein ACFE04_005675 [Oxalis oulophora]
MVARKFLVRHNDSTFDVDYDTDDGFEVLQYQLFSLTSVPPEDQKIVGGDGDRIISDDSDLRTISEKLQLLSVNDEKPDDDKVNNAAAALLKSDEELARLLQAEEEALMYQHYGNAQDGSELEQRLLPYITQVLLYEDPARQDAARETVPVDDLEEKAFISLAKVGNFKPSKSEQDHAFLLQLLSWFKQHFRWVNAPPCDGCGNNTVGQGMGAPLPSESKYGANRVEIYRCTVCSVVTRFPRYNDPLKLVETKRGRCGEWANCFTLYCRAFGYESRLILDFTDHVWTECFSEHLGRWMHLDPCEAVYDKPLLYEKGWNKKLNYVFAIARDGVYDVTKRYTRKWHEVLSRRNITTEASVSTVMTRMTTNCRRTFTRDSLSLSEQRDRNEKEELERNLHTNEVSSISLPGRQTGDLSWRILRGETGSGSNNASLSTSSCPIRLCVDEHVTRIYNSFSPILSHFVEISISKSEAVEVLQIIKNLLVDLRNSPYKTRRAYLKLSSTHAQLLPCFSELLAALSLKSESSRDESIKICLAGDPVKTSLALPVILDALDETILNIRKYDSLYKDLLSLPLLKLNRIHSGSVLASGEELPFGISTSAFDGVQASKWEEPNGARGCWIIYKLSENQLCELTAYELMSANDVPERDPMDWYGSNSIKPMYSVSSFCSCKFWFLYYADVAENFIRIVEGSNDEGSSWQTLDKQTSQIFDGRFQRKTFKTTALGFSANAFRFRFLRVRDSNSNPRFQIGSIDLRGRLDFAVFSDKAGYLSALGFWKLLDGELFTNTDLNEWFPPVIRISYAALFLNMDRFHTSTAF